MNADIIRTAAPFAIPKTPKDPLFASTFIPETHNSKVRGLTPYHVLNALLAGLIDCYKSNASAARTAGVLHLLSGII